MTSPKQTRPRDFALAMCTYCVLGLLAFGWLNGATHTFREHGMISGVLTVGIPPLAVYRAIESFYHEPGGVGHQLSAQGLAEQDQTASRLQTGNWLPVIRGANEIVHVDTVQVAREPTTSIYQGWIWAKKTGDLPVIQGNRITDAYSAARFDCRGRRIQLMIYRIVNGDVLIGQKQYTPAESPWTVVGSSDQVGNAVLDTICTLGHRKFG
jgi:hypothetical protein